MSPVISCDSSPHARGEYIFMPPQILFSQRLNGCEQFALVSSCIARGSLQICSIILISDLGSWEKSLTRTAGRRFSSCCILRRSSQHAIYSHHPEGLWYRRSVEMPLTDLASTDTPYLCHPCNKRFAARLFIAHSTLSLLPSYLS